MQKDSGFPGMSDLAFEYLIDAEAKLNSKLTSDENDYNTSEKLNFTIFYFAEKSLIAKKNHLNAIEDNRKRDYYELKRKDSFLK